MAEQRPARILNVEDNEAGLYAISRILRRAGFEVVEAGDGAQALQMVQQQKPDLVLLDVNLPDISGFEVCRRIKTDPATAHLPVVHLSATFVDSTDRVSGLDQGADGYLTQPVDPTVLVATLRAFLRLKETERALRESEERYRTLFETMPQGVVHRGADGRVTSVNPAAERILGRSLEEMQGSLAMDPLARVIHEDGSDFSGDDSPALVALRTGREVRNVVMGAINPKTNAYTWIEVNAVPQFRAGEDAPYAAFSTFDDITDRKLGEDALRQSEARLRLFYDSELIGVVFADMEMIWDANDAFLKTVGYTRHDLHQGALKWIEMTPSEWAAADKHGLEELVSEGRCTPFEKEYYRKDGSRVPILIGAALVEEEPLKWVCFVQDITERKAAEEALREGAAQLRGALHDTVKAMGAIVALRDAYTGRHEARVTRLAEAIAIELGLDESRREGLSIAGRVHDVGKISVPVEILSKPALLSATERTLVEEHAKLGYDILSSIAFSWPVAEMVHQHHERLDGSGYPQGIKGEQILLEARILGVADVVEAMASHRPYRPALGIEAALDEVRGGAGTRYDADVAAACEAVLAAGFELGE